MFVTREMIEKEGKRSPFIRHALVQSGDKLRVDALKQFLLSVGVCELTFEEALKLRCVIHRKKYRFMGNEIVFVFLDHDTFKKFPLLNYPRLKSRDS